MKYKSLLLAAIKAAVQQSRENLFNFCKTTIENKGYQVTPKKPDNK